MAARILPDANVLFSSTLRDWLLLIQQGGTDQPHETFFVYYTVDILAETINAIRNENPDVDGVKITTIHDRIAESMTARIENYPIPVDVPIAETGDRHVHAAAFAGGIDVLVTADSEFIGLDESTRVTLPYEIQTPDEFLVLADDCWPGVVRAVSSPSTGRLKVSTTSRRR